MELIEFHAPICQIHAKCFDNVRGWGFIFAQETQVLNLCREYGIIEETHQFVREKVLAIEQERERIRMEILPIEKEERVPILGDFRTNGDSDVNSTLSSEYYSDSD